MTVNDCLDMYYEVYLVKLMQMFLKFYLYVTYVIRQEQAELLVSHFCAQSHFSNFFADDLDEYELAYVEGDGVGNE